MPHADHTTIMDAIRACGLAPRGAFHPAPGDGVPALGDRAALTLVLVGVAGRSSWPAFAAAPEKADGRPHPLDRWTRRVVGAVAGRLGAVALYPFDGPPHHPFQRWAWRAEGLHPSPLGLSIHPEHGLWHAYRAALTFADVISFPARADLPSPCSTCPGRPCRSACPVAAIGRGPYDVPRCIGHVTSAAGADCLGGGCLARRACPVGAVHAYEPAQQAFHMAAFAAAHDRAP